MNRGPFPASVGLADRTVDVWDQFLHRAALADSIHPLAGYRHVGCLRTPRLTATTGRGFTGSADAAGRVCKKTATSPESIGTALQGARARTHLGVGAGPRLTAEG